MRETETWRANYIAPRDSDSSIVSVEQQHQQHLIMPSFQEQQIQQRQSMQQLIHETIEDTIPYVERMGYIEACEKAPHLVDTETDPILFLQYDSWNIWNTARRIVKYWEWKRTIFGDIKTFLPILDITGSGALNDEDLAIFQTGFASFLPLDSDGNIIVFVNRYLIKDILKLEWDQIDIACRLRQCFYIFCQCFHTLWNNFQQLQQQQEPKDGMTMYQQQTAGMIVINLVSTLLNSPTANFGDMINEALPIKVIKLHYVFCPLKSNLFTLSQYVIPAFLKVFLPFITFKVSFHYCFNEIDAVTELHQKEKIPMQSIPQVLGGLWSHDSFYVWLDQQRRQHSQRSNSITVTSSSLSVSSHDDPNNDYDTMMIDQNNSFPLLLNAAKNEEVLTVRNYSSLSDIHQSHSSLVPECSPSPNPSPSRNLQEQYQHQQHPFMDSTGPPFH